MKTVIAVILILVAGCSKPPVEEVIAAPAVVIPDTLTVTPDTIACKK